MTIVTTCLQCHQTGGRDRVFFLSGYEGLFCRKKSVIRIIIKATLTAQIIIIEYLCTAPEMNVVKQDVLTHCTRK